MFYRLPLTLALVTEESISQVLYLFRTHSIFFVAFFCSIYCHQLFSQLPSNEPVGMKGIVLSAEGQPVEGATVELNSATRGAKLERQTDGDAKFKKRDGKLLEPVLTDAFGNFHFEEAPEDADFLLVADHPKLGQGSQLFSFKEFMRHERPTIRFPKRIVVRGRVIDSQGDPVSNVRVYEYGTDASNSDERGSFECFAIQKSDDTPYRIELWKKGLVSRYATADRETVTRGDWAIEVKSEAEMTLRGQAFFADGAPLSGMSLSLELQQAPPDQVHDAEKIPAKIHPFTIRFQTDAEGRFQYVIPSDDNFIGKAVVTQTKVAGMEERRWTAKIDGISIGKDPLVLKFENRGQIVAAIFGSKQLPDSLTPTIGLRSVSQPYSLEWEKTTVRTLDNLRYYQGLEPGEYEFSVSLEKSGVEPQSVRVSIPNSEPFQAVAKLQIPKTVFGSVRAKLRLPDNQAPAKKLSVEVYGINNFHRSVKTDDDGRLQMEFLPVGDYSFVVSHRGISPNPIRFSVAAAQSVDLGTVRLKGVDEEFGWFDGSIVYEDRTSVGGVYVVKRYENDFAATGFVTSDLMPGYHLKPSGAFHIKLPAGENGLIFHLLGSARPSHFSGRLEVGREIKQKFLVDMDITAGATTRRDFHVPRRKHCRDITVEWKGMNEPKFSVISEWREKTRWIYSSWNNTYQVDATGKRIDQGEFVFAGFPVGPAFILMDDYEFNERMFAIKSIPEMKGDSSVIFSKQDLSSIQVEVVDANDTPIKEFSVEISALVNEEKVFVTGLDLPSRSKPLYGNKPWATRHVDGPVTVPNLGSGKYVITVSSSNWEHPSMWGRSTKNRAEDSNKARWKHSHIVDLDERALLQLRFQFGSDGKLIDTKIVSRLDK